MSEYSKLNFTDGTLLTAAMMNQLSDNIEYALETPPSGLNVNGKSPDETKKITITAADVGARADDWMPTAADVGALSGTDVTLTQAGKAADARKVGTELSQLKSDITNTSGMISDKWQNNKNYSANDLCIHNNILWRCTTQNLGSQPSETTPEWEQITLSQIIPCFTRKIYDVNINIKNTETIGGYYGIFSIPTDDIIKFGFPLYCSVTNINTHVGICGLTSDNNIYISTKQGGDWQVYVVFAKTTLKV